MADQTSTLRLRIDSDRAQRGLRGLDGRLAAAQRGSTRTAGSFDRLNARTRNMGGGFAALGKAMGPIVGLFGAAALVGGLFSVNREFARMQGQLITMTGSAEKAGEAFGALERFAAKTPFTLDQSVNGFTKLVALGLNPSERALRSYGNTAAGMGKDLSQLIEAVADASTGEFERLKEFGIKAKSEGDKVSFVFRGVTTTVGKNAAEIETFLQKLGEDNFGDAMANQMATLVGASSNAEDAVGGLFRELGNAGATNIMTRGFNAAGGALRDFTDQIKFGVVGAQVSGFFDPLVDGAREFGAVARDTESVFTALLNAVTGWARLVRGAFESLPGPVGQAFKVFNDAIDGVLSGGISKLVIEFPANFVAVMKIIDLEGTAAFDSLAARVEFFVDAATALYGDLGGSVKLVWLGIKASFFEAMADVLRSLADTVNSAGNLLNKLPGDFGDAFKGAAAGLVGFGREAAKVQKEIDAQFEAQKGNIAGLVEAEQRYQAVQRKGEADRQAGADAILDDRTATIDARNFNVNAAKAALEQARATNVAGDALAQFKPQAREAAEGAQAAANATNALSEAQRTFAELQRDATQVINETRTPQEDYIARIEKLNLLLANQEQLQGKGVTFDYDTYLRGVLQARDAFDESINGTADKVLTANEKIAEQAQTLAGGVQSQFEQFLFDPFDKGLDGLLDGFTSMLQQMAAQAAAAAITGSLFGEAGGGTGAGLFSAFFAGFAGAATGGPRPPGIPTLVGERGPEIIIPRAPIKVIPNDKIGTMGGGTTINNMVTVQAPEGRIDERSLTQLQSSLSSSIARAQSRTR